MKKRFSGLTGRNIVLALCCLLLALIFWFVVKYTEVGAYSTNLLIFG